MVSPSLSISSHLIKSSREAFNSADTLAKYSDPVGAGCIMSADGSGSRGAVAILLEQPAKTGNTLMSSGQVHEQVGVLGFSNLARPDGATGLGICTVFLQLGFSDSALRGLGAAAFLGDAGIVRVIFRRQLTRRAKRSHWFWLAHRANKV